ncbi:MAG: hypothetical protein HFJ47_01995 [Clostridia bacterium]|nr:hypothetical protein [Clostridia bacterium]
MIKGITQISYLLEVDTFWIFLILVLLLLLGIVKCLFPWQPKWKSQKTKDKTGNEVTIHYQIKE